jgi:gliding-associated putative ABC transporter substrate-binding component GldG
MKKTSWQTTAFILLVLVNLVLLNMIANTRFWRLDLTEGKVFTLSKASKQVVRNLDEPLTVKVFVSENLSPQLNDVKRYLVDILKDYRSYSQGNLRFEVVNPGNDEELEKEAQEYRIQPFQQNVWEKDRLELKVIYMGLVILYGDKQETIPAIQSTAGLEYNITSLIKRITQQQDYTVGFLSGHGEATPFEQMQQLRGLLETNYKVTTVDLATEETVPDNVDLLAIFQPTEEIPDEHKVKIDQYIMRGGPVGWFYNMVETNLQQGFGRARTLKVGQWTENYGFRVNTDLVGDKKAGMINVQQRRGFFTTTSQVQYPFFPMVETFNQNHPITADMEVVSFFFPSSVDTTLGVEAGVSVKPLVYSNDQSLVQSGRFDINALKKWGEGEFDRANVPLGVAIQGPFPSYDGNPVMSEDNLLTQAPDSTRMVVVGEGNFIQDDYLSNPANLYLVLNTFDWLMKDTDLISLRTREVSMRTLREVPDTAKQVIKYINWFLPPVLMIVLGIVYYFVRRNKRQRRA